MSSHTKIDWTKWYSIKRFEWWTMLTRIYLAGRIWSSDMNEKAQLPTETGGRCSLKIVEKEYVLWQSVGFEALIWMKRELPTKAGGRCSLRIVNFSVLYDALDAWNSKIDIIEFIIVSVLHFFFLKDVSVLHSWASFCVYLELCLFLFGNE